MSSPKALPREGLCFSRTGSSQEPEGFIFETVPTMCWEAPENKIQINSLQVLWMLQWTGYLIPPMKKGLEPLIFSPPPLSFPVSKTWFCKLPSGASKTKWSSVCPLMPGETRWCNGPNTTEAVTGSQSGLAPLDSVCMLSIKLICQL